MVKKSVKNKDLFVDAASVAVRKAGWSPRYDLEILSPDGKQNPVRYGYRADKVRLVQSTDLYKKVAMALELIGGVSSDRLNDVFYDVVASRVYLQVGSFKVCPYSVYDYHDILDACVDGLRSAGANEPEVGQFTVPVTSFFILSVVAGVYGIEGPDPPSFRIGWPLDHIVSSIAQGTALKKSTALYANIQLRLWSDDQRLAEVLKSRFAHPFDTLEFETDRGIAILLDSFEFAGLEEDGLAWSDDGNFQELVDNEMKYKWQSWPLKAFQWAEMMAPYIIAEQSGRQLPPQPRPNCSDRPSDDARERRRIITGGATPATQGPLRLDNQPNNMLPGVPIDPFAERLVNDPWFRQRLLQIGIGRGKSPINYSIGFEALDALYRSRVMKVEIDSEVTHKKGMAFEIAHMAREELGAALPGLNDIDWGATRIGADGKPKLYRKKVPITDQTPAKFEMAGFPDLLFIVDSSGSMRWDPKGGTGPYDALLRAIYSVFHFLERHNKAQYMRFAAVNFSNTTSKTAWHPFGELRKIKELLFKHQGGGTTLDCSVIQQIVNASADRFLCLMVTDAQISNAIGVFSTIKMMAERGHSFALIQIGRPTPLTEQVQRAGLAVHVINDYKQLEGLCLEYARKTW